MEHLVKRWRRIILAVCRMRADRSGNIAIIFSLSLVPLIGFIGLAVDYSKIATSRTVFQNALDFALLAAGKKAIPLSGKIAKAQELFMAQLSRERPGWTDSSLISNFEVNLSDDKSRLIATATANVPTVFMGVLGYRTVAVTVGSVIMNETEEKPKKRQVDFVFVIDATGSMQATINTVKNNALSFQQDLSTYFAANNETPLEGMRIRVIFFRDFNADGQYPPPNGPMVTSDSETPDGTGFFDMKSANGPVAMRNFVQSAQGTGGGDEPEFGLEAINEAMRSKWAKPGDMLPDGSGRADLVFPVIVLWSDAHAYPLPNPALSSPTLTATLPGNMPYPPPEVMPQDFDAYNAKWNDSSVIRQDNKLLLSFLCHRAITGDMTSDWPNDCLNGAMDFTDFGVQPNGYYNTIRNWDGHQAVGSVDDANSSMVAIIAQAVLQKVKQAETVRVLQ